LRSPCAKSLELPSLCSAAFLSKPLLSKSGRTALGPSNSFFMLELLLALYVSLLEYTGRRASVLCRAVSSSPWWPDSDVTSTLPSADLRQHRRAESLSPDYNKRGYKRRNKPNR
jgi:hypothetical protein